jgi:hypothetical protein
MKRVIFLIVVMGLVAMAAVAQAKNKIYGVAGSRLESEGYRIFAGDGILGTVEKGGTAASADSCSSADEATAKLLGDASATRSDNRLPLGADAKPSYSVACLTFRSVVERLKSAEDFRRLWLLFGDSVTDDYAVDILNKGGMNDETATVIEAQRLNTVAKYLEFFTKNKEWRLTEYTFLSQALKARKDKPLSPLFSHFIAGLLTGDAQKAYYAVMFIDLDNLGDRFAYPVVPAGASQVKGP